MCSGQNACPMRYYTGLQLPVVVRVRIVKELQQKPPRNHLTNWSSEATCNEIWNRHTVLTFTIIWLLHDPTPSFI
ncbi:hypothetical protein AHF37_12230 [Paragonimus kellicotti]|nr:hypothetical protein AHF37_12230 [Paragonimus kellicotti]